MQFTSLLLLVLLSLVHKCVSQPQAQPASAVVSTTNVATEADNGQLFNCRSLGQTCGVGGECSATGDCTCPSGKTYLYGCQEIDDTLCSSTSCETDQKCVKGTTGTGTCECTNSNFVAEGGECVPRVKLICKNDGFVVEYTAHNTDIFTANGKLSLVDETCSTLDLGANPVTLTVSAYSTCTAPLNDGTTGTDGIKTRTAILIMQFNRLIVSKYDIQIQLECKTFDDGGVSGSTKVLSAGVTGNTLTSGDLEPQYVVETTAHVPGDVAEAVSFTLGDPAVLKFSFIDDTPDYAAYTVLSCTGFPTKADANAVGGTNGYAFYQLCGDAQNELIIDKPTMNDLLGQTSYTAGIERQYLKFVSFKIKAVDDKLFIQCKLKLCPTTSPGAAGCEVLPTTKDDYCSTAGRKRREASGPITGLNGNTTEITSTLTVIKFKDGNSESEMKYHDDDEDDHVDSTTFVLAVAVLGTLLLISYILISLLIRAVWCKDPGYKSESRDDLRPFPPGYACHVPRVETGKY